MIGMRLTKSELERGTGGTATAVRDLGLEGYVINGTINQPNNQPPPSADNFFHCPILVPTIH